MENVSRKHWTWQGQGAYNIPMESKPTLTNGVNFIRSTSHNGPGTLANRFDHSSTLPRKASLANRDTCQIYFIAGAGLIKIGVSTNVQSRFRAIRNSSPVPVELLCATPGAIIDEHALHRRFSHLRRHGEWFEDCADIRDHIARLNQEPAQ